MTGALAAGFASSWRKQDDVGRQFASPQPRELLPDRAQHGVSVCTQL